MQTRASALQLFDANVGLARSIASRYGYMFDHWGEVDRNDAQQACLMGMWDACLKYNPSLGSFAKFAYGFIFRRLIDYYRIVKRHSRLPALYLSAEDWEDDRVLPSRSFDDDFCGMADFDRFLAEQSPHTREVLDLYNIGYSQRDIAKATGVSAPAISLLISRIAKRYKRFSNYPG